jgi:hypothetical protein
MNHLSIVWVGLCLVARLLCRDVNLLSFRATVSRTISAQTDPFPPPPITNHTHPPFIVYYVVVGISVSFTTSARRASEKYFGRRTLDCDWKESVNDKELNVDCAFSVPVTILSSPRTPLPK